MLNRICYQMILFSFSMMVFFGTMLLNACSDSDQSSSSDVEPTTQTPRRIIQLQFLYDWEKKSWINYVTTQFNKTSHKISDGQIINVKAISENSVKLIDELLSETHQAHLISPASTALIKLGNAKSRILTGKDMVEHTENLVLSPLVIALWEPMAKALGFPKKNIGWHDILALAKNSQSWGHYPQWGQFKLGHPHPQHSNSGLLSLFTQVYAGVDKLSNLTVADVNQPSTVAYLHDIQQTVAHYRQSSQLFYQELLDKSPKYLSAALLYENQVIRSYQNHDMMVKLVAIYPSGGTLWSEHPIGIVKRDWVTPAHYEAARNYIDYLLAKPQQEKALQYGFRPANVSVPLATPIDTSHGVNPQAPQATLEMPEVEVIKAIIKLWQQHKKPVNFTIVLDISGGMRGGKIRHARSTISQLLKNIEDGNYISLLSFNNSFNWTAKTVLIKKHRERLQRQIKYQFTRGGTALYDAINQAYDSLLKNPDKILAMVVFSDGEDSHSRLTFKELLSKVQFDSEKGPIRIFTIGYGTQAEKNRLREMAIVSQGKFYDGTAIDTNKISKDILAFF